MVNILVVLWKHQIQISYCSLMKWRPRKVDLWEIEFTLNRLHHWRVDGGIFGAYCLRKRVLLELALNVRSFVWWGLHVCGSVGFFPSPTPLIRHMDHMRTRSRDTTFHHHTKSLQHWLLLVGTWWQDLTCRSWAAYITPCVINSNVVTTPEGFYQRQLDLYYLVSCPGFNPVT